MVGLEEEGQPPDSVVTDDDCQEDDKAYDDTQLQREQGRLANRPDIDHLPPGVVTGDDGSTVPLFDVGDRVVAERFVGRELTTWLDTRTYVVREIDDDSGAVRCTDEETGHHAWIGFRRPGTTIRLAPAKGNPFAGSRSLVRRQRLQQRAGHAATKTT